ncbi:PREDICTED: protein enabled homolog [Ipomoea nil]|uniref:protein enabled homolog n=1 Tax=Ipomoea nil TaxID=35883 RepID=UPI000900BBF1|nr:PREDICTED: protein enabled homolog [Ipomoea nil]
MKMIKAMKKLKFWSRKKKKKLIKPPFKDHIPPPPPPRRPPPPPPPPCCHCYYPYSPVEPSAPPLPPGVDFGAFEEETHDTILLAEEDIISITEKTSQDDGDPMSSPPENITESYQKYMDPNPVYGVPATAAAGPAIRSERGAGGFGCVIDVGFHLFRCFFPCFHVREFK